MTNSKQVEIRAFDYAAAHYVASNMRKSDYDELSACRWRLDANGLTADCQAATRAWVAWHGNVPVAVFGANAVRAGVWSVFMFGTCKFTAAAIGVTRFMKRYMFPSLVDLGAHRIECASSANHIFAHKWLERCFGAKREAAHPGFGSRAELFYTFAWVRDDVRTKTTTG